MPGQANWSDITYYTAPGNGGGVLASGSASFVSLLSTTGIIYPNVVPGPYAGDHRRSSSGPWRTSTVASAWARPPSYGTSGGNWTEVYTGSAATAGSAAPTDAA